MLASLNSCFDLLTRMISRLNLLIQETHEGTLFTFLSTEAKNGYVPNKTGKTSGILYLLQDLNTF